MSPTWLPVAGLFLPNIPTDWPRIATAVLAFAVLCIQLHAWRRVRPTGYRRALWLGNATTVASIGYGVVEVMLGNRTEIRVFLIMFGLTLTGVGLYREARDTPPPPELPPEPPHHHHGGG